MGSKIFPNDAYFYWVIGYDDIDSFRWLIRMIKGACVCGVAEG